MASLPLVARLCGKNIRYPQKSWTVLWIKCENALDNSEFGINKAYFSF